MARIFAASYFFSRLSFIARILIIWRANVPDHLPDALNGPAPRLGHHDGAT